MQSIAAAKATNTADVEFLFIVVNLYGFMTCFCLLEPFSRQRFNRNPYELRFNIDDYTVATRRISRDKCRGNRPLSVRR